MQYSYPDMWIALPNMKISRVIDFGYKSNLFALAESGGFAVLIFPLLIFTKKIADTTYCGLPFFHVLRYLGIS
jgi:hypothetical protein